MLPQQQESNAQIFTNEYIEECLRNDTEFERNLKNDATKDFSEPVVLPNLECFYGEQNARSETDVEKGNSRVENVNVMGNIKTSYIIISKHVFYLNKSRSKWLEIGLAPSLHFEPVICLAGCKSQNILMRIDEWVDFISKKEALESNFNTTSCPLIKVGSAIIKFEEIKGNGQKIVKVYRPYGEEIYLAKETLNELFKYVNVVNDLVHVLRVKNFVTYYDSIVSQLIKMDGDVQLNVENFLTGEPSENAITMRELMIVNIDKLRVDVELNILFHVQ